MTDYSELIKKLRDLHRDPRPASAEWLFENQVALYDAAAAIEALQAEVERLKDSNEELREKQTFIDHYGTEWMTSAKDVPTAAYKHGYADGRAEVKAQLPKRGEWIIDGAYTYNFRELNGKAYEPVYRCSCCNRQTESYVRLDEPKMPEDADFPEYCPHCGAKMEAQE